MAAHQRQRAVGRDPIARAQIADHLRRRRLSARASASQLIAARSHGPATRIQRAQRDALLIGWKVQGMRTWSNGTLCLPGLGSPLKIQIPNEWAHAAVVISVLDATEERIARGETIVQPPPRRVRKRTGAIRINAVALGKLLHIKLGHSLHRPADLIGEGAYPIFKTVVIAHLHILAGGAHRQRAVAELLGQTGMLVLGRRGGEDMAQAWPSSHSSTGELMNALPKVAFSSTLTHVEWTNARVSG
jgi:hypothetical protein